MRKKSHISLTRLLIKNMGKEELLKHKKSFYIGSILPDCVPSFLTRRHTIDETFFIVKKELEELIEHYSHQDRIDAKFCRKLGVITHYIADYFTFPHNTSFTGSIKEHCNYEKQLKIKLREYVYSVEAQRNRHEKVRFNSHEDLLTFIHRMHRQYMQEVGAVKADIEYIVDESFQVVDAVVRLVEIDIQKYHYVLKAV